ncbi:MAG: PAS domain S-box protein, partial [Candidatus Caldatribacteriota bacterium]
MNNSQRFFEIIDQAPDAIIFSDTSGNIKLWNKMAEEIYGHQSSEALEQSLDIIIPERLRQAHWNAFHKAIKTGHTKYHGKSLTTKSIHKNGKAIYVKLTFSLVR